MASSQSVPPANSPRSAPAPARASVGPAAPVLPGMRMPARRAAVAASPAAGQTGQAGTCCPVARNAASVAAVRSGWPVPMSANWTGVASAAAYRISSAATCSAGGLDTSTMSSVAGSASSAARAARAERPPTAAERSRPPTPSTALTPAPAASSRQTICCAPVPEAATSPIGPAGTECEKPRPIPATIAVPQSGPITSRPRSAARSFSQTSCSTGTWSEKIITSKPASRASTASANANWPGTEISARPVPARRAALNVVRGGCPAAPAWSAGRARSALSTTASALASDSRSSAWMATSRSLGPAPSGGCKPRSASKPRFSSVAIPTRAACTPCTAWA